MEEDKNTNSFDRKINLKGYFRLPSKTPYAWALYFFLLVLLPLFGQLGQALSVVPWIAFIGQIVYNTVSLIRHKPKFDLARIGINFVLFILIALLSAL